MDFDVRVKLAIYETFAGTGGAPTTAQVAEALGSRTEEVSDAFRRLAAVRLLALDPDTSEIVMAPPFAAAPTPFSVTCEGRSYFANCVWDALGIAAALGKDIQVASSCGCCRQRMALAIRNDSPVPEPCVAHFAVPAARWWDDIVYT